MLQWEETAPADGRKGYLDGEPEWNTQISRMVYLLQKIAVGVVEKTFNSLSAHSRRYDGESYITKNNSRMEDPRHLSDSWCLEGCVNLDQKQKTLQGLGKLRVVYNLHFMC